MIERIEYQDKLLALVLRASYGPEGVNFLTPEANSLQLGVLKHKQGHQIKPHVHKSPAKTVKEVQEVLHIEYGEVEVGFYDDKGEKVRSIVLRPDDTILLISGGHGFDILRDCKIIEVKQGPYYGTEADKERLKAKAKNESV